MVRSRRSGVGTARAGGVGWGELVSLSQGLHPTQLSLCGDWHLRSFPLFVGKNAEVSGSRVRLHRRRLLSIRTFPQPIERGGLPAVAAILKLLLLVLAETSMARLLLRPALFSFVVSGECASRRLAQAAVFRRPSRLAVLEAPSLSSQKLRGRVGLLCSARVGGLPVTRAVEGRASVFFSSLCRRPSLNSSSRWSVSFTNPRLLNAPFVEGTAGARVGGASPRRCFVSPTPSEAQTAE